MAGVTRFGVSLDERLLAKFDRLIGGKGYANRSEAIRDLIRESLVREQWELGDVDAVGTLTLIYDHETRELEERLTELQHAHYQAIVSTLHVHLDPHHCLEVLVLRGKASLLKIHLGPLDRNAGSQARDVLGHRGGEGAGVIFFGHGWHDNLYRGIIVRKEKEAFGMKRTRRPSRPPRFSAEF